MASLNRPVLVGGRLYPIGTESTADLTEAITNPEFWDGDVEPKKAAARRPKSAKSDKDD